MLQDTRHSMGKEIMDMAWFKDQCTQILKLDFAYDSLVQFKTLNIAYILWPS